jgi:hypothetical protein
MSCEHLVCASCAGPVVEGRCAVCRASRDHVHSSALITLTPQMIAFIVAVLAVIAALGYHLR